LHCVAFVARATKHHRVQCNEIKTALRSCIILKSGDRSEVQRQRRVASKASLILENGHGSGAGWAFLARTKFAQCLTAAA